MCSVGNYLFLHRERNFFRKRDCCHFKSVGGARFLSVIVRQERHKSYFFEGDVRKFYLTRTFFTHRVGYSLFDFPSNITHEIGGSSSLQVRIQFIRLCSFFWHSDRFARTRSKTTLLTFFASPTLTSSSFELQKLFAVVPVFSNFRICSYVVGLQFNCESQKTDSR